MEKIIYQDEEFAIIETELTEHAGEIQARVRRFTRFLPTNSQFVLVLPFKKERGRMSYLGLRQIVPGWDQHPDLCGIVTPAFLEPDRSAIQVLKDYSGIEFNQQALVTLGVCNASKWSQDTYYLYAMDLTGYHGDLSQTQLVWVDENELSNSLDPQLITAMTRLKVVL